MATLTTRNGVFETNSSSVHTIVICKNDNIDSKKLPDTVYFTFGEFGWDFEEYNDILSKASYLYTALWYIYYDRDSTETTEKREDWLNYIKETLAEWNIKCEFMKPQMAHYGTYYETGYVDHGSNLKDLLNKMRKDKSLLLNFLFCDDTTIYTGNDNCDEDELDELYEKTNNHHGDVILTYKKGN